MNAISIAVATRTDENHVASLLTLAFSTDPVVRFMYPDPVQYLAAFPRFAEAFGGAALDHGTTWYTEGWDSVALWLAPGGHIDEAQLNEVLSSTVDATKMKDFSGAFAQMVNYHPKEPHWYLSLIGTDPVRQSIGRGSALMRHTLAVCDRDNTVAYLESSNARNIPLYERHGYMLLGKIESGGCPPIFPMLRRSQR